MSKSEFISKTRASHRFASALVLSASLFTLLSCTAPSGITPSGDALPLWARQPTRTVDNGYIVYVESDDNSSGERAKSHAEAAALADLMNECTMIPKGVRIEDRFDHKVGPLTEAYAKVAVEMETCEQAKRANTPDAIRLLANVPMTEEVKRFHEQIGQTDDVLASAEQNGSGENAGSVAMATPSPMATSGAGVPGGQMVAFRDDEHFYIVREQVAVEKQAVVLAPPNAYQPQSPEYAHFTQTVPAQSQSLASYEAQHPEVKTTGHPWSYYRHTIMRPRINTGNPVRQRGQAPRSGEQQNPRRGRGRRHGGGNGTTPPAEH